MKRKGNFYHLIYNRANLLLAHNKAKKGKLHYSEVKYVEENLDFCLLKLQTMLKDETYSLNLTDYTYEVINDKGKERELYKLSYYPHRIIQWAIINVISNTFYSNFIYDTYASIKGKGIHSLVKKLKRVLVKDIKGTSYCLKIDIKKYYNNINNKILYRKLERKFKDKRFLKLMKIIIFSRGDKGQPIGSLLSQYLANFYLSSFDHYCKEILKLKYYFRYMDDIVILHESKEYLHQIKRQFDLILTKYFDLEIKSNWQVFLVDSRGVDYVGYRFFRYKTLLRRRIYLKARYCFSRPYKHKARISYYGWCKHANIPKFMKKYKLTGGD